MTVLGKSLAECFVDSLYEKEIVGRHKMTYLGMDHLTFLGGWVILKKKKYPVSILVPKKFMTTTTVEKISHTFSEPIKSMSQGEKKYHARTRPGKKIPST